MKSIVSLFCILFTASFYSCTLDIDFDDEDQTGSMLITTNGRTAPGEIIKGETLHITITASDKDGIEAVSIAIPELQLLTEITSPKRDNDRWTIDQSFDLPDNTPLGRYEIIIKLRDRRGNEYSEYSSFSIIAQTGAN